MTDVKEPLSLAQRIRQLADEVERDFPDADYFGYTLAVPGASEDTYKHAYGTYSRLVALGFVSDETLRGLLTANWLFSNALLCAGKKALLRHQELTLPLCKDCEEKAQVPQ